MPKPDREPDPSSLRPCPQCGFIMLPTPMSIAEHRVLHREHAIDVTIKAGRLIRREEWPELVGLYQQLDIERKAHMRSQRVRIVDLEIDLEAARWDLKVAGDLIEDLKAELAAVTEGRH